MSELSKYIRSESVELNRSAIHFADYNPRTLSEEAKKTLKRGIKKYGLVGGVVVNKQTGLTIVSGHQRVTVMDELQKYNPETKENDYKIRVDVINVDAKQEKELNILMNNPNAQGSWDFEKMRELIPDIDYKDAGLTEADLNLIGVDFLFQTEQENDLSDALSELMSPVTQQKEETKAQRQAELQMEREAKIQHMKDVKAQLKQKVQDEVMNMDAYVMISFDTWHNKASFCERFGYSPNEKFIKGEIFDEMIERID